AVGDDLVGAAGAGRDHRQARGHALDDPAAEGLRDHRRVDERVDFGELGRDVVREAAQLDTVAESELRDQIAERPLVLLLAEQRRADDHGALVAAGERTREGAQEHVLALPGSDPADHRGDERLSTAATPGRGARAASLTALRY